MKTLRIEKPFALIAVILFAIVVSAATLAQADDSVMAVKGTIVSVDPNSGEVAIVDDAGKTFMLQAGSENDLKTIQKGDAVTIEYDKDSVIKSIQTQK